ncbi:MAG: N-acetylmuramoyl-L-alanine amidase [Gemmatimonadaceae bacterium]
MLSAILALQLAVTGADTLSAIAVRDGDRRTVVAIQRVDNVAMVSADRLAAGLGGSVRRAAPDRYILSVVGMDLELTPGAALVRVRGRVVPLAAPPRLQAGQLLLPLTMVSDALPRLAAPNVSFDVARAELRRIATTAAAATAQGKPVAVATLVRPPTPKQKPKPVVVIDPGHGGPDRGMRGPMRGRWKVYEADLTLQIGRRLRDALRQSGVDVIMTRSIDTLIALADRGRIANDRKADLFLSLHVNAANPRWRRPGDARGFETYFLSEARTDDARRVEELENSSIQYEVDSLPNGDDALSFILKDMKQNESLRESQLLAEAIQGGVGQIHPGPSRGVKQAGFRVLVAALVPAVLVEVGFGTNATEARYLASTAGQRALANAIAKATLGYLSAYDRRRTQGDTTH